MSDDDHASDVSPVPVPEVSPAAPEVSKGWSEQDRRTLIITIGGTLAANLATVVLVGGALAFAHLSKTSGVVESRLLVGTLGVMAFFLVMILVGTFAGRVFSSPEIPRWLSRPLSWYAWFFIATCWLFELFGVMILIGLAAGVK
jgi:hypothetical protein